MRQFVTLLVLFVSVVTIGCGGPTQRPAADVSSTTVDAHASAAVNAPANDDAIPPNAGESGGENVGPASGANEPADADDRTAAGSALASIFSPIRAPQRKTMGLLQRSFLDLAAEGDLDLEIAIVVDGTESMAGDLAGVRDHIQQMLDDLRKCRKSEVRVAMVVYRDEGSPSGPVVFPQKFFTSDRSSIAQAVQSLKPETGEPYFYEMTDVGLYDAVNDLPWTLDDQVTKWILLFGDAAPYPPSLFKSGVSENPDAPQERYRKYGTDLLIDRARAKQIRIHCLLCTGSNEFTETYMAAIDETRSFMNTISAGTDGLMLDLSSPQVRSALVDAAKQPDVEYEKINPITAIDLASVRRDDVNSSSSDTDAAVVKTVRLAVLPHMPLDQIRSVGGIDPAKPAVQVSTALRTRLAQIAGVYVASPIDIYRQLRRMRAGNSDPQQQLRGLAAQLGVDYVVWGQVAADNATYQTAAYRRDTGQRVFEVSLPGGDDQGTWTHYFLSAASKQAGEGEEIGQLLQRLEGVAANNVPMAKDSTTSSELLKALEALDQALEYDTRSQDSQQLLEVADKASKNAAKREPRNPLAHWLQANVAYNQAANLYRVGNKQAAVSRMKEMKSSLSRAIDLRADIHHPSLLTEIEGDYFLLVKRDIPEAIARYETMTQPDQPLQSQLRGHWMLSGIYAGDWGNAQQPTVDPAKARLHVMQIMANWPNSPQASLLKKWLNYDETRSETEFNYLPRVNVELSGA